MPSVGAPGAIPQSRSVAANAAHGKSWMLRGATSGDLLYVSDGKGVVKVFTYPKGQPVGELEVPYPHGSCSDKDGNIYISSGKELLEFTHGGTTPVATFTVSQPGSIKGCAVDPSSGTVAATVQLYYRLQTYYVAIFADGNPNKETDLTDSILDRYTGCVYDNGGDLFIVGSTPSPYEFALTELPKNGNTFDKLTINGNAAGDYVQWDGNYLTMFADPHLYQLQISGSTATLVGTVTLQGRLSDAQPWLAGNTFVASTRKGKRGLTPKGVAIWNYPSGGEPISRISWKKFIHNRPISAMTVSIAPR